MSGFFEQLVARIAPMETGIQPRRASRFENTALPTNSNTEKSAPAAPAEKARTESRPTAAEFSPRLSSLPAPEAAPHAPPVAPLESPTAGPPARLVDSATPHAPDHHPIANPANTTPEFAATRETRRAVSEPRPPPAEDRSAPRQPSPPPLAPILHDPQSTPAPEPGQRIISPKHTPLEPRLARRPPVPVTTVVSPVAVAPPSAAEPAPAAPIVRINIGTIEVRAVMPSAPATTTAPRATPPPRRAQSLDDYLARRERPAAR